MKITIKLFFMCIFMLPAHITAMDAAFNANITFPSAKEMWASCKSAVCKAASKGKQTLTHFPHHLSSSKIPDGSLAEMIIDPKFTCPECLDERLAQNKSDLETFHQQYNPLHWAIRTKKNKFVEILLKHGARTDMLTPDGQDPLSLAINNKDFASIQCLIFYGAKVTEQIVALAFSKETNLYYELQAIIEDTNNNGGTIHRQRVEILDSNGQPRRAPRDYPIKHGRPQQENSAKQEEADDYRELIVRGSQGKRQANNNSAQTEIPNESLAHIIADPSCTNSQALKSRLTQNNGDLEDFYECYNALHWAIKTKKDNVVEILLHHGANVQAPTQEEVPLFPLALALRDNPSVVHILLIYKANPNVASPTANVPVPLLLAAQNHDWQSVFNLIKYNAAELSDEAMNLLTPKERRQFTTIQQQAIDPKPKATDNRSTCSWDDCEAEEEEEEIDTLEDA